MAETTNPSQNPGGNKSSISTTDTATATVNAAAGKAGGTRGSSDGGRRHRSERFKPRLKNPVVPTLLLVKPPRMSGLNTATVPAAKVDGDGGDHKRMREDGLATTLLAGGKKPGYGAVAGSGSGTEQASRSVPRSGSPSAGAARDFEEAVPIAELWNQAFEQLREIDPKLIKKYEEEISLHVSTMVGTTVAISGLGKVRRREQMELLVKQKLKEDEDGKWRIPLGHDRTAIRDLAGSVVSIVDWGKEFVGKALESSPYGSLAWAGVCLLLPLILNPSKQRASNICGLEYISDLLSRCTMYEYAYHQRYEINRDGPSSNKLDLDSDGFRSALKELYLRILRFQARSVCQFSRNPVSGGVRAVFKMDDWDTLLEDIKLQVANCEKFFESVKDQEALDTREEGHKQRTLLLLDKLEELNVGIKEIGDKLEKIHFSEEESKCFETLRTINYLARKDLNPERFPGTCNWILDHPKYQDWIAQTPASTLLWVSGDPGCGKSVFAKALVDQYDRDGVCYYFFKDETTITRSAAHAICAILHQICDSRPVLIKYVLPMYRRNREMLVDLFEDLWIAFTDMMKDNRFGNIVCILDAIDECSNDDYKKLLQRLAAVATSSTSIKILITSRPYTSIETALFHKTGLNKNEIRLSGEAMAEQSVIEKEVGSFIRSKVEEFQELRESYDIYDNAHEKLQTRLDSVKNRTYLWVSAIFNELERDVDAPEYILMETIKTLPESVDKAYKKFLETTPKPKKHLLMQVLHIMLAAFRPLSVTEMNLVLSIQDTSSGLSYSGLHPESSFSRWLRNLCGFFVNIVNNEIYFLHQTAKEFLIGEEGYQASEKWRGSFQLADSHTILARFCIDYLILFYGGSVDATFEIYATRYWPAHCQRYEVDQSLTTKVNNFIFSDSSTTSPFIKWHSALERLESEEFLFGEGGYQATAGWQGGGSFQLADSHTLIARICIDYLLRLYGGSVDAGFEVYATRYWPTHCARSEMEQSLADKVKDFIFDDNSATCPFIRWHTALNRLESGSVSTSPTWVAFRNACRKVIHVDPGGIGAKARASYPRSVG